MIDGAFRRAVLTVGILNLGYFVVELTVAQLIGSVSLLADSVDFLEDTAMNGIIFFAVLWAARARVIVTRLLAVVILVPAVWTFVTAVLKVLHPLEPAFIPLSLAGLGALIVNLICAFLLARHRRHPGGLASAAWLSARNDALANVAIIAAAAVGLWLGSGWPDIVVGVAIGIMNAGAAIEVWRASSREPAPAA